MSIDEMREYPIIMICRMRGGNGIYFLSLAILSPVLGYFGTIDFLFIITKKKVSHISLKDRADIDLYKRMFVILTRWISNKKHIKDKNILLNIASRLKIL
jgi:hypothetical protein